MLLCLNPRVSRVTHACVWWCVRQRVVTCVKKETVGGMNFVGYGAHMDNYPVTYLSFACAIGIT